MANKEEFEFEVKTPGAKETIANLQGVLKSIKALQDQASRTKKFLTPAAKGGTTEAKEIREYKKQFQLQISAAKQYGRAIKEVITLLKHYNKEISKSRAGKPGQLMPSADIATLEHKLRALKDVLLSTKFSPKVKVQLVASQEAAEKLLKTIKNFSKVEEARAKKVKAAADAEVKRKKRVLKVEQELVKLAIQREKQEVKAQREAARLAAVKERAAAKARREQERAVRTTQREKKAFEDLKHKVTELALAQGRMGLVGSRAFKQLRAQSRLAAAQVRTLATRITLLRLSMSAFQKVTLMGLYQSAIFVRSLITSFMVLGATIAGVVFGVRALVQAAFKLKSGQAALKIVSKETGRDWAAVQGILSRVVNSGFLPLVTATKVMINLLAIKKSSLKEVEAGMWSIIAATQAMKRGQIETAQAAEMVAEGIRQQMSRMTDAAGEGVNVNVINKEMARTLGLVLGRLSFEEKQRLTLIGYTKKHAKYTEMLSDANLRHQRTVNRITTAWTMFKAEMGEMIMPLFTDLLTATLPLIQAIRKLTEENKKWFTEGITPLIKRLPSVVMAILGMVRGVVKLALGWAASIPAVVRFVAILGIAGRVLMVVGVIAASVAQKLSVLKTVMAALHGNILSFVQGAVSLGVVAYVAHQLTGEMADLEKKTKGWTAELERAEGSMGNIQALVRASVEASGVGATTASPSVTVNNTVNISGGEEIDEAIDHLRTETKGAYQSLRGKVKDLQGVMGGR